MIKIGVGVLLLFFLINCTNSILEPVNISNFFSMMIQVKFGF